MKIIWRKLNVQINKIDYNKYLKTNYWKGIKDQVLERDGFKCRLCNSEKELHVHHRTYDYLEDEKLEELITLCKRCHYITHRRNLHLSYKMYCENKEWEERRIRKEKETIDIWNYISDNRDKFDELNDKLIKEKYIRITEFKKIIKKLNVKKFDNILFINNCLKYINGITISTIHSEAKEMFDLPKKSSDMILDKNIYDKYPDGFIRFYFANLY